MGWLATAWGALKLVVQYGPAAVSLVQNLIQFVKDLQAKFEEKKRESNIDKAVDTKNPDDLEKSYRSGSGGA